MTIRRRQNGQAGLRFRRRPGARRLDPRYPVWVDAKEKTVIVDGQVCLRQGMLEMFACTRNTKEHEAIVSADTKAYWFTPGFWRSAPGRAPGEISADVPAAGGHGDRSRSFTGKTRRARSKRPALRIGSRDIRTKKAMTYPFVFGGSTFWTDPESRKQYYQAEGGDFVCVSNFGTAMLDIPVKSSQSNEELEFEAFTEKIPPLGTPVRLVFKPNKRQGAGSREQGVRRMMQVRKMIGHQRVKRARRKARRSDL